MPTHELFARTRDGGDNFVFVALFARLSSMEPTADAQTLPPVLALADDDLLHRVKAPARLHLKKHKLVPRRRDAPGRDRLGLEHGAGALLDGVQLERAAPRALPGPVVRQRHVEDVRDAARADHVVVVEQVAALAVRVDGHVLLHARERAAARHGAQELAELGRVECIAEPNEVREERDLLFGEIRQRCKIACLVDLKQQPPKKKKEGSHSATGEEKGRRERYLVYVGFFFRKVKFAETLVLDFLEKVIPKELADKGVFEGLVRRVRGGQSPDIVRVE